MRLPIRLAVGVILGCTVGASAQAPPPPARAVKLLRFAIPVKEDASPAATKPAAATATANKPAPAPVVDPWIEQLASRDFRVRENAAREIMKIGVPALPALQSAKSHRDAEVRRRVDEMITVLERAAALAPKLVTLKMEKKSVRDVLNEMAKQTGFKIPTTDGAFNGPQGKALHSFEFQKTPFWEALDKVCEKCGLIMQPNGGDSTVRVSFQDSYEPFRCYDGSFKVLATGFSYSRTNNFAELPKTPYQPGDLGYENLQLNIQICVEPRVPILKVGAVRLTEALDDAGTSMLANGGNYYDPWNRYYNGGNNRTFVQNTSANMAWPAKHSRTVKSIKGIIPVTLLSEQKAVVVTDAVLTSTSKKFKVGGATFNIDSVTVTNKQHEIKITYNEESSDNPYDYSRIQTLQQRVELQDAKGQKVQSYVRSFSQNGVNNAQFTLMTQTPANAKTGPPAKLVYQVWVQMEHEVAFEFKDLPLP